MEPLLEQISTLIPDEKIDHELSFSRPRRGPHADFKPSQLYRVHLLFCFKRLASLRQLQKDLKHYRDWRRFAHLKNQTQVPSLRALSWFRQGSIVMLRQINKLYLKMIFAIIGAPSVVVAVPDSTDIKAATRGYAKKTADASALVIIHDFILQKMQPKDTEPKNLGSLHSSLATKSILSESSFLTNPPLGTSPL